MAIRIYRKTALHTNISIINDLSFENAPFVNLIDRQTKDMEGRSIVWKAFSDLYLGRLVAVNIPESAGGSDYENYLASFATDLHVYVPAKPPVATVNIPQSASGGDYKYYLARLATDFHVPVSVRPPIAFGNISRSADGSDYQNYPASLSTDLHVSAPVRRPVNADRPLSTPSLGSIVIRLTHALWDDVSIAFSVEYTGSLRRVGGQRYTITEAWETDLYVLVSTHDRSRSTSAVSEDLIKRWKSGDTSRGEIHFRALGFNVTLSGDVRPVLLPGRTSYA